MLFKIGATCLSNFIKHLDRKSAFHVRGHLRLFEIEIVRFFFVFVSDSRRHGGKVIRLLVVHLQVESSGEGDLPLERQHEGD